MSDNPTTTIPDGPPILEDEALRQFEVDEYDIVDTLPEQQYDDLVKLAAHICETPISALTLIDRDRQWFKSSVGLSVSQTPRQDSFCAHVIAEPAMMMVNDATADPRFSSNPLVTSDPNIRFYAGAPLININGYSLGAICVIDTKPHTLTDIQQDALMALGRIAISLLEQRRQQKEYVKMIEEREAQQELDPVIETNFESSEYSSRAGYPHPPLVAASIVSSGLIGYLVGKTAGLKAKNSR